MTQQILNWQTELEQKTKKKMEKASRKNLPPIAGMDESIVDDEDDMWKLLVQMLLVVVNYSTKVVAIVGFPPTTTITNMPKRMEDGRDGE